MIHFFRNENSNSIISFTPQSGWPCTNTNVSRSYPEIRSTDASLVNHMYLQAQCIKDPPKNGLRLQLQAMCSVAALVLLAFSAIPASYATNATPCRCLFGDPCWPFQADFDSLAQRVSQPFLHPLPPARPCYVNANLSECAAVVANWTDGNWRADQPGSMQNTNFETFTFSNGTVGACYLNVTIGVPCQQGSVSVIGVDARTTSDAQAAVNFAAEHNLRLVVKSTG